MNGLQPVDIRTAFIQPDRTQMNLIRNQNSGQINTPELGKPVPCREMTTLISKHHQSAEQALAYVQQVAASADAEKAMIARMAQYARHMTEKRTGGLVDTHA